MRQLVLENQSGQVIRTFPWTEELLRVVVRKDTRRLEVVRAAVELEKDEWLSLAEVEPLKLTESGFSLPNSSKLRVVEKVEAVAEGVDFRPESKSQIYKVFGAIILMQILFLTFVLNRPRETPKLDAELKQQVVKIARMLKPRQVETQVANMRTNDAAPKVKVDRTAAMKRMGALAVLGSLNSGKQRGGLNLGAVQTTAGPGLGGTQGSGGVQTSIYGKGIVSAPLGAGSRLDGGGGYGTKGKGGGQAGYGKLTMVGSNGTALVPLGKEAIVDGGLDADLISDVIRRNMGQIRFCYEQGLQLDPGLAGRVAVKFVIGSNGEVRTAQVDNTTMNSKQVEDCVLLRLRTWKFPLPQGGSDVKVSYPFSFRRSM